MGSSRNVAFSETDRAERAICPFVAAVAIHRVVAAADRGNPFDRELREVARRRERRDVTAVGERVDPRPLGHPLVLGQGEQRAEVIDVRVHPAVRDEPEKMNVSPAFACPSERGDERDVLGERPVGDGGVHAGEILEEDPPGADREVADLGVPHLTGRQSDRLTRRGERPVREALPERVEHRRPCELDGVPRAWRSDPPAVEDDEDDGSHKESAPARQTASNDGKSSEAPPTSAPSTSGNPRRTSALSGLTEPP